MICGLITSNFGMGNKLEEITSIKEKVKILKNITEKKRIFIVCSEEENYMSENNFGLSEKNIIKVKKESNNNIRITAGILHVSSMYNNPNILLMQTDNHMSDIEQFASLINKYEKALDIIRNGLVTFGMKPAVKEGNKYNYSYIRACSELKKFNTSSFYKVEELIENPLENEEKYYLERSNYLCDSGIYLFKTDFIIRRMKQYIPNTYTAIKEGINYVNLSDLEKESILYKIKELYVVPTDIGWYKSIAI